VACVAAKAVHVAVMVHFDYLAVITLWYPVREMGLLAEPESFYCFARAAVVGHLPIDLSLKFHSTFS